MKRRTILLILILLLATFLRLFKLDRFPPSLYSDEINQAYNAYSILKTGKDEHGVFLPVSFRSFGDWKPPLQTYLMVPTIAIFGLTELVVRLPNALLGIFSILLGYFLILEIFNNNLSRKKIALLSSFFLAISPWHIHQSRSAMLVMVALFFFMLGIYFFIRSLKNKNLLFLSLISFILAIYSYYGMRLIVPLFLILIVFKYHRFLMNNYKTVVKSCLVGFVCLLPLLFGFLKEPNVIFGRAKSVSVLFDKGVKLRISELQAQDGVKGIIPQFSLFFHNKPYLYFLDVLRRFFSHLDGQFLFIKGDLASPFRIPRMGVLYLIDAVFLPLGLFYLFKNKEKANFLLFAWLIISILPASLTFLTPAHNRSFNLVLPMVVISSYGILNLVTKLKTKLNLLPIAFSIVYIFSLNFYLISFYKILPQSYSSDWLYGFKQLVEYINLENDRFDKFIFLPKTGTSYVYLLFYNQYPPDVFQKEAVRDYVADNLGFEHVKSFDKYIFFRNERSWEVLDHQMKSGEMYIGREDEIPKEFAKYEFFYPDGKVAFRITYSER